LNGTLAVVGGGAAGLLAALRAAELLRDAGSGVEVVVLEAAREAGRKILVSGGGRCNILPMDEAPGRFVSSSPPRLVRRFLDRFPLAAQRSFFERLLGGPLLEEPESRKLFPPGNRAQDVRDALVAEVLRLGVRFEGGAPVREVLRNAAGFRLRLDSGELAASKVIIATGGRSVLGRGADAAGFGWAEALGHRLRPLFPALAPLVAEGAPHAVLAGISVETRVTAVSGPERAEGRGGFLFTHRGYSGPAVLDVSHVVERALLAGRPVCVTVRFEGEPDWDEALRTGPGTLVGFLRRRLPDRLVAALLRAAGVADGPLPRLPREARRAVVGVLEGLQLPVTGTEGYRTAEVTGGGVALEEVDPGSGESRLVPGLYFAGEILDAFGPIGGFNFQWAWATGWTAGEGAARSQVPGAVSFSSSRNP
jgi:hypothetical protein